MLFFAKACTTFGSSDYSEIRSWQKGTGSVLTKHQFSLMKICIDNYIYYRDYSEKLSAPYKDFLTDAIIMAKAKKENEKFIASF